MELRDYLRVLRAHWLGIVLLTVIGVAVAFGWTALQPRVYTATTSGYVSATTASNDTGSSLVSDQLARAKVTSFLDIGSWRSVAQYAIDELDLDATPEQLVNQVDVSNPLNTVVIHVSARASTPEAARDLAEAWLRGMVVEINHIEGDGSAGSAAVSLNPGDSARLPTAPSSPNVRLALALGALVGLALGVAYGVVRHVLDRRVREPREIERQTGTAVVGVLPVEKDVADGIRFSALASPQHTPTQLTEATRKLRTNLQFMSVDDPPRIIMVTSPLPGDGKSTVSANLAVSLASTGQRVILIDGDLRRPTVAATFGVPEGVGLSDVLAGRAELADAAIAYGERGREVVVLGAGSIPPNPTELLSSNRMRALLQQLRSEDFTVLIDSPPTIPVADAAALSSSTDGALIVSSAGKTTYEALQLALENVTRGGGRVLGIVLNKVPRRGSSYYGYRYNGTYEAATDPAAGPRRRTGGDAPAETSAEHPLPAATRTATRRNR